MVAWVRRFIFDIRNPQHSITAVEIGEALRICMFGIQDSGFFFVIRDLDLGKTISCILKNSCSFLNSHPLLGSFYSFDY